MGGNKFGDVLNESGVGVEVLIEELIKGVCEVDKRGYVKGCVKVIFKCVLEAGMVWEELVIGLVVLVKVGYILSHELLYVIGDGKRGTLFEPICWGVVGRYAFSSIISR